MPLLLMCTNVEPPATTSLLHVLMTPCLQCCRKNTSIEAVKAYSIRHSVEPRLTVGLKFVPMEDVHAKHAKLQSQLSYLSRRLRNDRRRTQRTCCVPPFLWQVVTAIFVLSHPTLDIACLYLERKWKHWHKHSGECRARLTDWHANLQATDGVQSVLQPATPSMQRALRTAQRFLQELNLHAWVDDANQSQGIAPLSSVMLHHARATEPPATVTPLVRAGMKRKSQLQWLRRWRRRWNVGLGSVAARDTLAPAQCQEKAAFLLPPSSRLGNHPGPRCRSGPNGGCQNGCRLADLIWGPLMYFLVFRGSPLRTPFGTIFSFFFGFPPGCCRLALVEFPAPAQSTRTSDRAH